MKLLTVNNQRRSLSTVKTKLIILQEWDWYKCFLFCRAFALSEAIFCISVWRSSVRSQLQISCNYLLKMVFFTPSEPKQRHDFLVTIGQVKNWIGICLLTTDRKRSIVKFQNYGWSIRHLPVSYPQFHRCRPSLHPKNWNGIHILVAKESNFERNFFEKYLNFFRLLPLPGHRLLRKSNGVLLKSLLR